jgi:hypothetical protein
MAVIFDPPTYQYTNAKRSCNTTSNGEFRMSKKEIKIKEVETNMRGKVVNIGNNTTMLTLAYVHDQRSSRSFQHILHCAKKIYPIAHEFLSSW